MSFPARRHLTASLLLCAATAAFEFPAYAQQESLLAVRGTDDAVYVYVLADMRLTTRFNLTRVDDDGEHLLTPTPLAPTDDPGELVAALGPRYEQLAEDLGTESPMATLLRLIGDDALGVVLSISDSTVGRVLGRLYIDRDAPGGAVRYRADFPAESFEADVADPAPPPPISPSGSAVGSRVTVTWKYDPTTQFDDFVTSFTIDEVDAAGSFVRRITNPAVFRVETQEDYLYSFEAPVLGRTYRYRISALTAGWETVAAEPISVEVVDNVPPGRVTSLVARALADTAIVLSWLPPASDPDAEYSIRRAPRLTGPFREIARTSTAGLDVLIDRDLIPRTTYHYSIIAIDSLGNESAPGDVANAYVPDLTPPPAPSALEALVTDGSVDLGWSAERPADFNTFVVLRRRLPAHEPPEPFSQANRESVRGHTFRDNGPADVGFAEGAFYEYAVAAADSAANFSDSVFVIIQVPDVTPPDAPTSLTVRTDDRRATVTWAASTSRDVVAYNVYRVDDGIESRIKVLGADGRSLRDPVVPRDVAIQYRVEAQDSSGNVASSVTDVLTLLDADAPAPPTNIQTVRDGGGMRIRWTGSAAADLSAYIVERAAYAGAAFEPIGRTENLEWSDSQGKPGVVYRVVAIDEIGNQSAPSTPIVSK